MLFWKIVLQIKGIVILSTLPTFTVFKMAFMAMKKNLDERARKKGFDEIFLKFDHNKNGCIKKNIMKHFYRKIF